METPSQSSCRSCADGNTRCSYFFKIMIGGFRTKLGIPPAFVKEIRKEADNKVFLEGPTGQQWSVYLGYSDSRMEFQQGWAKFVDDHRLEFGDFLVFKYIPSSNFVVQIFGRTGCLKKYPHSSNDVAMNIGRGEQGDDEKQACIETSSKMPLLNQCAEHLKCSGTRLPAIHDPNEYLNDQKVTTEISNSNAIKMRQRTSKTGTITKSKKKFPTQKKRKNDVKQEKEERVYVSSGLVSCRRAITDIERENALTAANSFRSKNVHSYIVMKKSHVYRGFWLSFPRRFDKFNLPKERVKVTLLDADDKQWTCIYLGDGDHNGLSGGWRLFSIEHNLEEGDVCVYELVDLARLVIRVHIFRVVETCTPYIKTGSEENGGEKKNSRSAKKPKTETIMIPTRKRSRTILSKSNVKIENDIHDTKLYAKDGHNSISPSKPAGSSKQWENGANDTASPTGHGGSISKVTMNEGNEEETKENNLKEEIKEEPGPHACNHSPNQLKQQGVTQMGKSIFTEVKEEEISDDQVPDMPGPNAVGMVLSKVKVEDDEGVQSGQEDDGDQFYCTVKEEEPSLCEVNEEEEDQTVDWESMKKSVNAMVCCPGNGSKAKVSKPKNGFSQTSFDNPRKSPRLSMRRASTSSSRTDDVSIPTVDVNNKCAERCSIRLGMRKGPDRPPSDAKTERMRSINRLSYSN